MYKIAFAACQNRVLIHQFQPHGIEELIAIGVADGNLRLVVILQRNKIPLDKCDLGNGYDKGFVHPHESIDGQFFFQRL